MFGHLKAHEFMNVVDGGELPENRRAHLRQCETCASTLGSVKELQSDMRMSAADEAPVLEPEWQTFRSGVRNRLLSRAVKRESESRRWTGWMFRPAMAWSLSVVFILGLTVGVTVLRQPAGPPAAVATGESAAAPSIPGLDLAEIESIEDLAALSQAPKMAEADVFDQLVALDSDAEQRLQALLEGMTQEGLAQ